MTVEPMPSARMPMEAAVLQRSPAKRRAPNRTSCQSASIDGGLAIDRGAFQELGNRFRHTLAERVVEGRFDEGPRLDHQRPIRVSEAEERQQTLLIESQGTAGGVPRFQKRLQLLGRQLVCRWLRHNSGLCPTLTPGVSGLPYLVVLLFGVRFR